MGCSSMNRAAYWPAIMGVWLGGRLGRVQISSRISHGLLVMSVPRSMVMP